MPPDAQTTGKGPALGPRMMLQDRDIWIFDLDNTLYPAECNLFTQVSRRMTLFIAERFGLDHAAARELQKSYFARHGTTLRGLMTERGVKPDEVLAYVHDIDFSGLSPDPRLARAIANLPGRKLIHTNGSRDYAIRVLERLQLGDVFDHIFDIIAADFMPKPDISGYRKLVAAHGVDPRRAVMVEDIARNLIPAAELGMATCWIACDGADRENFWAAEGLSDAHIHYRISDLASWLEECYLGPPKNQKRA